MYNSTCLDKRYMEAMSLIIEEYVETSFVGPESRDALNVLTSGSPRQERSAFFAGCVDNGHNTSSSLPSHNHLQSPSPFPSRLPVVAIITRAQSRRRERAKGVRL
jgi:hypothetical protein